MRIKKLLLWAIPVLIFSLILASISYEKYKKAGWTTVPELSYVYANAVAFDQQNNPWFADCAGCTFGGGVIHYDGNKWISYTEENSGLISNDVYDIAIDQSNNIWFATEKGVSVFDGFTWVNFNKENSSFTTDWIARVTVDPSNNVWINTIEGVWVYDGETWEHSTKYDTDNFPNFDTNPVDPSYETWTSYGYNTGVNVVYKNKTYSFTEDNSGLPSNTINEIATDKNGKVWILTFNGVVIPPKGEELGKIPSFLVKTRNFLFAPDFSLKYSAGGLGILWLTILVTTWRKYNELSKKERVKVIIAWVTPTILLLFTLSLLGEAIFDMAFDGTLIFVFYIGWIIGFLMLVFMIKPWKKIG